MEAQPEPNLGLSNQLTTAFVCKRVCVREYYMLFIYVWNGEFIYIFFILYALPVTTTTLESSRRAYNRTNSHKRR